MNKYIDDMRQAVMGYRDAVRGAKHRVSSVEDEYGSDAAARERTRQDAKLQTYRRSAEAAIREAYSEGVYLARERARLAGDQLTDDIKLLDAGIVDAEAFEDLKQRHRDNATMLLALKKYGEQRNAEAASRARDEGQALVMDEPFMVRDITTLSDRMKNWDAAKAQAMGMLDMLDGTGAYSDPWFQAIASTMGDRDIEAFGDGVEY